MTLLDERTRQRLFDLPAHERATLGNELLNSLDGELLDANAAKVQQAWSVEIRRRLLDLVEGRAKTIPGDEVFQRIRANQAARVNE